MRLPCSQWRNCFPSLGRLKNEHIVTEACLLLGSSKAKAYSSRFVRPISRHPCPPNNYWWDLNETWFIDSRQREDVQCTWTLILCLLRNLLLITFFHNGCLSALRLGKNKRDWNKTWYNVDGNERKCSAQEP